MVIDRLSIFPIDRQSKDGDLRPNRLAQVVEDEENVREIFPDEHVKLFKQQKIKNRENQCSIRFGKDASFLLQITFYWTQKYSS